jgi:hypothetical protein
MEVPFLGYFQGVDVRTGVVLLGLLLGCSRPGAVDLDGRPIDPTAAKGTTVLVFVGTECPVSNRYAPEIAALEQRYASRGAAFWLVYPGPHADAAAVRAHETAHGLHLRTALDPKHVLVGRTSVHSTPEAAVLRDGEVLYHGRIDDRQVELGVARSEATTHELADAIDASLAGKRPAVTSAPAIGCSIP